MATVAPIQRQHRTPPHDHDTETALLGAMLLTRDATDAAITANVTAADFYTPNHATIYDAILTVRHRDDHADPTTVAAELADRQQLTKIGGRQHLLELQAHTPASASAHTYARRIHDLGAYRRVIARATDLAAAGYAADTERIDQVLADLTAADTTTESTWRPLNLTPILDGDLTPPATTILQRDDHHSLLYPGRVHAFNGESESMKTWLALLAVHQELDAGHHVAYLDFEDTPESILSRLLTLGATRNQLINHFTYIRPAHALDPGAAHRLDRLITELVPTLVIIDGVTEAMSIEGLDLLDNTDVATWLARLPRRIADLGPSVAMIDHVTKSTENRGRHAIGAQHKLAGIDGAAYSIEVIYPLARLAPNSLEPVTGIARITIAKDRPGAIRGFSANSKHVGQLELTAYPDGGITGHIVPATELPEGGFRPTVIMERICKTLSKSGVGLSKNAIRGAVKGKNDVIELALALLVNEGYLAVDKGPRGALLHRLVKPFDPKAQEDETE